MDIFTYFAIDSPQTFWCVGHLIMRAGIQTCHPLSPSLPTVVCLLPNHSTGGPLCLFRWRARYMSYLTSDSRGHPNSYHSGLLTDAHFSTVLTTPILIIQVFNWCTFFNSFHNSTSRIFNRCTFLNSFHNEKLESAQRVVSAARKKNHLSFGWNKRSHCESELRIIA